MALLVIGLFPGDASAHRGSATYLIVEPTEGGANVTADLEIVDAAMELGLGEDAAEEAVLAQAERVRAWIARGIWLEGEGGAARARSIRSRARRATTRRASRS